jgi:hypothetical protein
LLKISLINMPFGALQFPSIALTQFRAVTKTRSLPVIAAAG